MTEVVKWFPLAPLKTEGAPTSYISGDAAQPSKGDPPRPDLIGKGITIAQLIQELAQFPQDMRVMVAGYESGYDDPETPRIIKVQPDPVESSVYGNYEDGEESNPHCFSVVLLDRP